MVGAQGARAGRPGEKDDVAYDWAAVQMLGRHGVAKQK